MVGKVNIEMSIINYGHIKLELDADNAPITVTNFVGLINDGFYTNKTFHRIIKGFMIQGGSSDGRGYEGSDKQIKGEFASNGIANTISHVRGTISMARSSDPDSASSQFFIVHQDSLFLDGNYAAFGKVIEGMDVVDKIAETANPIDNNGTIPPQEQPIIEYIKVI